MTNDDIINRLFSSVLSDDIQRHRVNDEDIRTGIVNMKEVYLPNPTSLSSAVLEVADYNDIAHRIAYLHKYAPFHTALVEHMFSQAMENEYVKLTLSESLTTTGRIEVCSLGGGPGSDVLGVILALIPRFGFFQLSATIIDLWENWEITFNSIAHELRYENYGDLGVFSQPQYFDWNYIGHNLLGKMTIDVNRAIQSANLVTMVKFISASACQDTTEMIKKIFRCMKPGALILYIDNAGGGFHQIMQKCARDCNMRTVFGPLKHQHYTNMNFNVKKFGYTPCLETKVSVHVWQKPKPNVNWNSFKNYLNNMPMLHHQTTSSTVNNTTESQSNIVNSNIFYTPLSADSSNVPQRQPRVSRKYSRSKSNNSRRTQEKRCASVAGAVVLLILLVFVIKIYS